MSSPAKITAILGTYRKGGVIDSAVEEILVAAREAGAETEKIYLLDKRIEFCTNCRACTQQEGQGPGQCGTDDDMRWILDAVERSDALVLASPMNFWSVTALMKRFIERLVCFAYWPWGKAAPEAAGPPPGQTRRGRRFVRRPGAIGQTGHRHGGVLEGRRPAAGRLEGRRALHRPCRRPATRGHRQPGPIQGPTPGNETGLAPSPVGRRSAETPILRTHTWSGTT